MNVRVSFRGIWVAAVSGLVVLLVILLVVGSYEAMWVVAELDRRLHQTQGCVAALRLCEARPLPVAQACGWIPAEEQQLQARVQAIIEPHDGTRR
jgi:hypothetical protein